MAKKITTLRQLEGLVLRKKAVWVKRWGRSTSAAFLIRLPGAVLLKMFNTGMYEYKKEEK